MLRYPLRLKLGALAALILFVAAIAVVGLALWRQEGLAQSVGGDANWAAYKLDREAVQLRTQLMRSDDTPDAMNRLRLRFELLYSRLNLLRHGEMGELLQSIPRASDPLEEISARIERLDEVFYQGERLTLERRMQLSRMLDELGHVTEQLVIAINNHLGDTATLEREALHRFYQLLLGLILAMSLAATLVVAFLFREARESAQARRAMEALSRELEITARRAESASQAKSDFLATVSHEIRTPLNGVIGMSELLCERQLDETSMGYARIIHDSADVLLNLINDLLDFSKIEAGQLELERVPFSLRELFESAVSLFAVRAAAKRIGLHSEIAADVEERLVGDPGRLKQVLLNLLSNAIKFSERGEVRLKASRSEEGRLLIEVIDCGIGIPEAQQARLFEPFRQGDASTARRYGGTGLGLAICKRLVTAMQGEIGFESQPGEGSRFWFKLPMEVAEADEVRAETGDRQGPAQLLLVEDNIVNQQVASMMLERLGYGVDVATCGQEALTKVGQRHYDLIFMDVDIPDMDGLEITRRIRRLAGRHAEVPIVAMTAGVAGKERSRCLEAGMDDYLAKPLYHDALSAVMRRHLRRAAPLPSPQLDLPLTSQVEESYWLDGTIVRELWQTLGRQGMATMLAMFEESAAERLQALEAAIDEGDSERVRRLAHLFKGEAGSLGLQRLMLQAGDMERATCGVRRSQQKRLLASLRDSFSPSLAAFRDVLERHLDTRAEELARR